MPEPHPIHLTFNSVNPSTPEHALEDGECASATNIDFGLGQGAARVRRGSTNFGTLGTASIGQIFRNYNLANNIFGCPFYAVDGDGKVYRGSGGSWTTIMTGGQPGLMGVNSFGTYALFAGNGKTVKDDGTNTTEWIKQQPSAPTVTVATLSQISYGTGSFSVVEGTLVGTATQTITASANSNGRVVVSMTLNGTSGANLTVNGTETIGDFGVHFVDLAFGNPSAVQRISQDWSVGDATFHNYWHAELFPQNALVPFTDGKPLLASAQPDPNALIDSQLSVGTSSNNVDQATREQMLATIRAYNRTSASVVSRLADTLAPWAVARPDFSFVGTYTGTSGTDAWASVYAVRYIIEMDSVALATIANIGIEGAQNYPLTDVDVGYSYWQTYATLDSGGHKIGESAPSPPSARTRMQNAKAIVTQGGTATGTIHGITHVITYRQGGYMRDAYAIATTSYGTAVTTITDTLNDIQALSLNYVMPRNILTTGLFPGAVQCISEPWNDRVFLGQGGPRINWSLPGQIDTFPITSTALVGHEGDNVKAMVAWPPGLVIINQYSVYELSGSDFENGQWTLQRSGSRHGSIAPRVPCKTPYGIPLLNWDGLTMYVPGQGSDQEIDWLNARYGDMFRFQLASDPAAQAGSRIPAINQSYMDISSAIYGEGRLYLAAATGTDTIPHTVYVIDFPQKRCWWYTYPFGITSLFWDFQVSRLFAGTDDGKVMEIETGQFDTLTNGTATSIPWSVRTKRFSAASDTLLENVFVECSVPSSNVTLTASFDGSASAVGTFTNTARAWNHAPLNGTFVNSLEFLIQGTNQAPPFIYEIAFDLLEEPYHAHYFRTPYNENGYTADKQWDVQYCDVAARTGTGTITAVTFIDNVATLTNSFVAPFGLTVFEKAFPLETYGLVAYTTYTSSNVNFQVFDTRYTARNEPPKVTSWQSEKVSGPEHEWKTFVPEVNPSGATVLATVLVEGTAVGTYTMTGTDRLAYTFSLPVRTFGRTLWADYVAADGAFKVYSTEFEGEAEPSRVSTYRTGPQPYPSSQYLKTWLPLLDPRNGTVTGTLIVDDVALTTVSFTGDRKQWFTVGLDIDATNAIETGSRWEAIYSVATDKFKHYETRMETEPKPFGKKVWAYGYRKQGGASQLDMPRFISIEAESTGTVTGTYFLDVDSSQFTTGLLTFTGGVQWIDRIAIPPGARGRIFEFRLQCGSNNVKLGRVNLDFLQEGIKALTRREQPGTPTTGQVIDEAAPQR